LIFVVPSQASPRIVMIREGSKLRIVEIDLVLPGEPLGGGK